jgi:ABC-type microcin C transport system duplicated ATPase subunit YejF
VRFEGEDLLRLSPARLRELRGARLSMIFQEPMTSLNPAFTVGDQVAEALLRHEKTSRKEAKHNAIEMLRRVRIRRLSAARATIRTGSRAACASA